MTVRGKIEGAAALCKTLKAREFLMLVRDLLVMRDHTAIRIMDGPGDGCRDIHSRDAGGNTYITQVAHAQEPKKTIGSKKIGELPNALLKFGAKAGLVVTSGRISPQAKRECTNDYPGFTLDFLDGDAVADEILRQIPLKAIWFDGRDFGRVSNSLRIPLLLRDLEKDCPIELPDEVINAQWQVSADDIQVQCLKEWMPVSRFTPYRQPETPRVFEGIGSELKAQTFVISGSVTLDMLAHVCDELARQALERVPQDRRSRLLAVRVGKPSLVPLRGDWAGSSIAVGPDGFTLLREHDGVVVDEWNWLADIDPSWCRATQIRGLTAAWLRRYQPRLDLCASVELITTFTEEARFETSSQVRLTRRDWDRSVCLLAEQGVDDQLASLELQPSERFTWVDGRTFLVWGFRTYAGPFASIADVDDEGFFPIRARENAVEAQMEKVRDWARGNNYEIVPPERARHIKAIVDEDPYPSDRIQYRFVDIETGRPLPSPLDPRGRLLLVDVAYQLSVEVDDEVEAQVAACFVEWEKNRGPGLERYEYEIEASERKRWFLHLQILETGGDPLTSTRARLDRWIEHVVQGLGGLERVFAERCIKVRRATRQYWVDVCTLDFRVPASATESTTPNP